MKYTLSKNFPTIIGGMVMDLRGRPKNSLELSTSNPGNMSQSPGGVGRNISENLVRLGVQPFFISAIGADPIGQSLLHHSQTIGLDASGIINFKNFRTAIYLAILEQKGDLHTAIADMDIFEELTPERILPFTVEIKNSSLVVIDTNLPLSSIKMICQLCQSENIPLWIEPVSVVKSKKIKPFLSSITYLSPNLEELGSLADQLIQSTSDIYECIEKLLSAGLQNLLVTMGRDGVLLANESGIRHLSAIPANVVDVTGAGDAFVAGTIYGLERGFPLEIAIHGGLLTAKMTVESEETVCSTLSNALLDRYLTEVL